MFLSLLKPFKHLDFILIISIIPLLLAGLFTMNSFEIVESGTNYFFRQSIWISISILIFLFLSTVDFHFLRKSGVVVGIFLFSTILLLSLFIFGKTIKGSTSWLSFGVFSFQPSDFAKLALIILLAKYFTKRHIEIAYIRHIIVSGAYALILFLLVMLQPDFGSGIIILTVWLGMVLISGISKKHLLSVFGMGLIAFVLLWNFGFKEYQKNRILTFIHPLADIRGAGYNAYQSTIAVGSGEIFGKGVGYGTQSRLNFLPEYETDFIFAAYAEEWGFVGSIFLFISFFILIWRIIKNALLGESNFEILFGLGLAILFLVHFTVNVGMNIGLLPVTGIPLPFVSYGGSHLLISFIGLGILMGMRKYNRATHKDMMNNEFLGL